MNMNALSLSLAVVTRSATTIIPSSSATAIVSAATTAIVSATAATITGLNIYQQLQSKNKLEKSNQNFKFFFHRLTATSANTTKRNCILSSSSFDILTDSLNNSFLYIFAYVQEANCFRELRWASAMWWTKYRQSDSTDARLVDDILECWPKRFGVCLANRCETWANTAENGENMIC